MSEVDSVFLWVQRQTDSIEYTYVPYDIGSLPARRYEGYGLYSEIIADLGNKLDSQRVEFTLEITMCRPQPGWAERGRQLIGNPFNDLLVENTEMPASIEEGQIGGTPLNAIRPKVDVDSGILLRKIGVGVNVGRSTGGEGQLVVE